MKALNLVNRVVCGLAALMVVLSWAGRASAEVLYVTTTTGQIYAVDTTTNTLTPVFTPAGVPDSLMFATNGNIIYTLILNGQVRQYNPTTSTDTLIATGFNEPADVALEPSGTSMLVSEFFGGKIDRINLLTNSTTTLGTYGGNPQGLAFDSAGHLFAVLGTRTSTATSFVARLDPITGAILGQTSPEVSLDGLTYDAFSGKLFSPSTAGTGIYQIDPVNLAITLLPNSTGVGFDGITTDSAGNLYIASASNVYQYILGTQTLTPRTTVPGLDDLAPLTGLGAQTGHIEICKASDPNHPVTGSFNFTAANSGFSQGPISVPVGQCSGSIQVPSGAVTVTETPTLGVAVSSVTATAYDELGFQHGELTSWFQPDLHAVVHVTPGDQDEETIATFTNYAASPGQLKICKVAGDDATLGLPFTFTASSGGQTNTYIINAGAASQGGNCVLASTFPVNTQVTITEASTTGYSPLSITVSEGQLQSCAPAGYCAIASIVPGITEVTYTNVKKRKKKK